MFFNVSLLYNKESSNSKTSPPAGMSIRNTENVIEISIIIGDGRHSFQK